MKRRICLQPAHQSLQSPLSHTGKWFPHLALRMAVRDSSA